MELPTTTNDVSKSKAESEALLIKRYLENKDCLVAGVSRFNKTEPIKSGSSKTTNITIEKPATSQDSSDLLKCTKTDHTNCTWRCNVKQSERYKTYYHTKVKDNRSICEYCGISVLNVYKKKHLESVRCQNTKKTAIQAALNKQFSTLLL